MRAIVVSVRQTALLLACLLAFSAQGGAQVAIQVKSGSGWSSSVELKAVAPLPFRWRWDGAAYPTAVVWQLATIAPTSTAANRAADVVASSTSLKLPGKSGAYEEFTVTPVSAWPSRFYIRVRVNVGQKSVYSRWVNVSIVSSEDVVRSPTCTVAGVKAKESTPLFFGDRRVATQPITPLEVIQASVFRSIGIGIVFRNPLNKTVTYRRDVTAYRFEVLHPAVLDGLGVDPQEVRTLAGGKADTVRIALTPRPPPATNFAVHGLWRFAAAANPLNGVSSKCELRFNYVVIG